VGCLGLVLDCDVCHLGLSRDRIGG
jgi:hypothetical protein